nr:MAG TPA: hypothetical protein [Caudoviricetes sp.]
MLRNSDSLEAMFLIFANSTFVISEADTPSRAAN